MNSVLSTLDNNTNKMYKTWEFLFSDYLQKPRGRKNGKKINFNL